METASRDVVLKIMSLLDEQSFLHFCSTNKRYNNLCKDRNLLIKRLNTMYPESFNLYKEINGNNIDDWDKVYKEVVMIDRNMERWRQEMIDIEDDENLAVFCNRNVYTKYICKNDDMFWKERTDKHYPNNQFKMFGIEKPEGMKWSHVYASIHRIPAGSELHDIIQ